MNSGWNCPSLWWGGLCRIYSGWGGQFDQPQMQGEDRAVLVGQAPVQQLAGYGLVMAGYTKGTGQLSCTPCGYKPCQNPEQAIQQIGYDAQRDLDNPADSVFCSHGAGYPVPWQEVHGAAHIPVGSWRKKPAQQQAEWNPQPKRQRTRRFGTHCRRMKNWQNSLPRPMVCPRIPGCSVR